MIFAITIANIKKALTPKKYTDPTIKVLVCHYKHLNIFLRKKANKLTEHWLYNHKIIFKEGTHSRFKPLYRIS